MKGTWIWPNKIIISVLYYTYVRFFIVLTFAVSICLVSTSCFILYDVFLNNFLNPLGYQIRNIKCFFKNFFKR